MRCRNSLRFRDDVAGCAAIGHAPGCAPGFALAGAGGYAPAGTLRGMHRGLAFSQTPARKAGTGIPERDDVAAVAVLRGDLQWQMERKCVRRRERS